MPGAVWCLGGREGGQGRWEGGGGLRFTPLGCGRARVGLEGIEAGFMGAARPSLCLPCNRTIAGFLSVALVMEGAVTILLRFVSLCFHQGASRGAQRGSLLPRRATSGPGRQASGSATRPKAHYRPACLRVAGRLRGRRGGDGQGARGALTRLCAWRGSRGGGGGGSLQTWPRGPAGL